MPVCVEVYCFLITDLVNMICTYEPHYCFGEMVMNHFPNILQLYNQSHVVSCVVSIQGKAHVIQ